MESKEDVQEQALNILVNIASTPEDIDILFQNFTGDDLMKILAEELDSPSEEVVCQVIPTASSNLTLNSPSCFSLSRLSGRESRKQHLQRPHTAQPHHLQPSHALHPPYMPRTPPHRDPARIHLVHRNSCTLTSFQDEGIWDR